MFVYCVVVECSKKYKTFFFVNKNNKSIENSFLFLFVLPPSIWRRSQRRGSEGEKKKKKKPQGVAINS